MAMTTGWRGEGERHNQARLGIKTGKGESNKEIRKELGIKTHDNTEEYIEHTRYFIPNYDPYGNEIELTTKQRRVKNWLVNEIKKEKLEMFKSEARALGPNYMARYSDKIRKNIDDNFLLRFQFGVDGGGPYVEVSTDGYAKDIIYEENGGVRWGKMAGRFHRRFEKEFHGYFFEWIPRGRLRAYLKQ
jgi:bifunctional DNA-binding transcriptional regulator/antitoxin component of YhaV-PrlF toxin-antitoxin module